MTQIERTPEEIATEIAKSAAKVAMVRALHEAVKTAAPAPASIFRGMPMAALEGAGIGTLGGGLVGGMASDDEHRARGALQGALAGGMLGGLGSSALHAGQLAADAHFSDALKKVRPIKVPKKGAGPKVSRTPRKPTPRLPDVLDEQARVDRLLQGGTMLGVPALGALGGLAGSAHDKHASVSSMALRALGGALAGGALGGGAGALSAHMRGADVRQSAATGALGGAGIGAGLGALSSGVKGTELQQLQHRQFGAATAGVLGGAGALFGKKLVGSLVGGEDSEAAEARQKELGRFEAMQQIKVKQLALLEPMHAAAFEHAQQDEIISRADPSLVHSSFETMKRFAPNIAADPNAVRSFLRESASWGAGPSYATLKNLADAERSVAGAGGAV